MVHKIQSILLADDDNDDQLLFEEALHRVDATVSCLTACDGVDLLEKLTAGIPSPDLLFLDVNMPRMNGIDCLKQLSENSQFSQIPIIMYSTSSFYRDECLKRGASGYMEKPSDFQQLCQQLKFILSKGLPFPKNAHLSV